MPSVDCASDSGLRAVLDGLYASTAAPVSTRFIMQIFELGLGTVVGTASSLHHHTELHVYVHMSCHAM